MKTLYLPVMCLRLCRNYTTTVRTDELLQIINKEMNEKSEKNFDFYKNRNTKLKLKIRVISTIKQIIVPIGVRHFLIFQKPCREYHSSQVNFYLMPTITHCRRLCKTTNENCFFALQPPLGGQGPGGKASTFRLLYFSGMFTKPGTTKH